MQRSRAIFAIANFHRRPEIAAISDALEKTKGGGGDLKVRISIARKERDFRAEIALFLRNLALAKENR